MRSFTHDQIMRRMRHRAGTIGRNLESRAKTRGTYWGRGTIRWLLLPYLQHWRDWEPTMNEQPKSVWIGDRFGKEPNYACKRLLYDGSPCPARFDKPQSLGAHVTAFHTKGPDVLEWAMGERRRWNEKGEVCPWGCGETFHSPKKLGSHIFSVHKDQVEKHIQEMKDKN